MKFRQSLLIVMLTAALIVLPAVGGLAATNEVKIMLFYAPDDAFWAVAREFEQDYDAKVTVVETTWGEIYSKLVAGITTGDPVDLVFLHQSNFPFFVVNNAIQPVDPYFDKEDPFWALHLMDNFKWNDQYYGLAGHSTVDAYPLFYNKTMFENYGLMTPNEYYEMGEWNWETFLDVAEQLSVDFDYDGVNDQWGVAGGILEKYVLSNNADFVRYTEDGGIELTLGEPATVAGLQFLQDLRVKYQVDAPSSGEDLFVAGKVGMLLAGDWFASTLNAEMKDEWDIAPFPQGPNADTFITPAAGKAWAIPVGAKNPQGGADFLKYFLDESRFPTSTKDQYTAEQAELIDFFRSTAKNTRFMGIGNLANIQYALFEDVLAGKPIATVVDEYTPIFQAEIDKTLEGLK